MTTYHLDHTSACNSAAGWWRAYRYHRWMVLIGADRFTNSRWAVIDDFGTLVPALTPVIIYCE